ncbi:MAG: NFACT family protein, partial [Firmicutes bacterium]|nr:NFACT family protein [Bacillota bacterium]
SIDVNRVRQILPGALYQYPPTANLTNTSGFGPSTSAAIEAGSDISNVFDENSKCFRIQPPLKCYVYTSEDGNPKDFHIFRMKQYEGAYKETEFGSACEAMDWFYSHKANTNRTAQKSAELSRHIGNLIDKYLLKKQRLLEEIKKADDADIYRLKGELLNANLHLAKPGDKSVRVISYYDGTELSIELDEKISAAKNAQNYYKKYAKLKSSKKEKENQLAECEKDIDYLSSVQALAQAARSAEEIDSLREELHEQGYIRAVSGAKRRKKEKPSPRRYVLPSGLEVLVGRNNTENDYITFKLGQKTDWWFHTKDIHGSHVLLVCNGTDPSPEDMYGAASIAAWYSKGRDSQNVPVDYAPVRFVKKPNGAKPGMVIFTNNGTVWVDPKDPE